MRQTQIGAAKPFNIHASALTLMYYQQEFGGNLAGEIMGLSSMEENPQKFDPLFILQIAWAMAKSAQFGQTNIFSGFAFWLASLGSFSIADKTFVRFTQDVLEEATEGLFRTVEREEQNQESSPANE